MFLNKLNKLTESCLRVEIPGMKYSSSEHGAPANEEVGLSSVRQAAARRITERTEVAQGHGSGMNAHRLTVEMK